MYDTLKNDDIPAEHVEEGEPQPTTTTIADTSGTPEEDFKVSRISIPIDSTTELSRRITLDADVKEVKFAIDEPNFFQWELKGELSGNRDIDVTVSTSFITGRPYVVSDRVFSGADEFPVLGVYNTRHLPYAVIHDELNERVVVFYIVNQTFKSKTSSDMLGSSWTENTLATVEGIDYIYNLEAMHIPNVGTIISCFQPNEPRTASINNQFLFYGTDLNTPPTVSNDLEQAGFKHLKFAVHDTYCAYITHRVSTETILFAISDKQTPTEWSAKTELLEFKADMTKTEYTQIQPWKQNAMLLSFIDISGSIIFYYIIDQESYGPIITFVDSVDSLSVSVDLDFKPMCFWGSFGETGHAYLCAFGLDDSAMNWGPVLDYSSHHDYHAEFINCVLRNGIPYHYFATESDTTGMNVMVLNSRTGITESSTFSSAIVFGLYDFAMRVVPSKAGIMMVYTSSSNSKGEYTYFPTEVTGSIMSR